MAKKRKLSTQNRHQHSMLMPFLLLLHDLLLCF